jgi:hypothetical protein
MSSKAFTFVLLLTALASPAAAAIITVTTTDNASGPGDGQISLYEAIEMAQEGDTVRFNISGAGPHVIQTPIGGYPLITVNDLTIDGYSQPGASPNTNPILGGNNAVIKIVLDSRDEAMEPSDPQDPSLVARRSTRLLFNGFGDTENAILGVYRGKNFKVRGISFLSRHTPGEPDDPSIYCVAFANGPGTLEGATGGHVSGCWFGLHPNGTTVAGGRASVATFRNDIVSAAGLVVGTDGNGTDDRAEFNVHIAQELAIHLQVDSSKVSGNYVNVFPDGLTFVDLNALAREVGQIYEPGNPEATATIEFYENANAEVNAIIGTDGDGVADADERNIVCNVNYSETMEFWRAAANVVIAGNYFGVGIDGVTPSPVSLYEKPDFVRMSRVTSNVRVGSNGDGVSDDVERNLIFNLSGDRFVAPGDGRRGADITEIVVRRNKLVNCDVPAVPFSDSPDEALYLDYYADVVLDPSMVTPALQRLDGGVLRGRFAEANAANYPFAVLDVYTVDPGGLAKTNYWPLRLVHPSRWLGAYRDNGPDDMDPDPNKFAFNLTGFSLSATASVAVAVTYSKNANSYDAGTAVTSPMSNLVAPPPTLRMVRTGPQNADISWIAGANVFVLQGNAGFDPDQWLEVIGTPIHSGGTNTLSVLLDPLIHTQFFRLSAE